ncbi:MAG: single-stranded DNA-binding protein [Crocinitomicaceae bacterium]|nr:single-stranded DNA-binding protein [Crocinitomicaceae bacterium]
MATVFETRLIGNIGKDAVIKTMEKGVVAVNFPVAHNKNWKDKRTGEQRTKTTWVNCTIWKRDGGNMRILDFLKKGTLVEIVGTPFAKGYLQEDQTIKTEIRLNVSKTNILRPSKAEDERFAFEYDEIDNEIESGYSGEDATARVLEELEEDLF